MRPVRQATGLSILGAVLWMGACSPPASPGAPEGTRAAGDAVVNCNGLYGTTPSPDGTYYITAFGCYTDANGNTHGDPGDNCIPACLTAAKASLCSGMSGPTCEKTVNWYAADSGRYGCMTRLRVTNPKNGKSAVVVVLDAGPSCFVEHNVNKAVLDMSPPANDYLFGGEQGQADHALVQVEIVDGSTALGPVTSPSAGSTSSATTTSATSSVAASTTASTSGATTGAGGAGGAGGGGPSSTATVSGSGGAGGSGPGNTTPCSGDGDCNPGNDGSGLICVNHVCVPGCHGDAQCPGVTTCVNGQCQ